MNKLVIVVAILAVAALILSLSKGGLHLPPGPTSTKAPAQP